MYEVLLTLLVVAGLAVVAYAFLVEPYRVEVTYSSVEAPLAEPLKIAQLSDLHTSGLGRRERELLDLLAAQQPDVILITGDTLGRDHDYERIRPVLSRLRAPLGVWLVRGNSETYHALQDERAFYSQLGIHFLENEAHPLRPGIWLVGLDNPSNGRLNVDAALTAVPEDVYAIAAFHLPEFFDKIAGRVSLGFAGHTHGGQVRLPFVRAFPLPRGAGLYVGGWYTDRGSRMYVSRGIGTSSIPIRFRCAPELPIIVIGSSAPQPHPEVANHSSASSRSAQSVRKVSPA